MSYNVTVTWILQSLNGSMLINTWYVSKQSTLDDDFFSSKSFIQRHWPNGSMLINTWYVSKQTTPDDEFFLQTLHMVDSLVG